VDSDDDEASIVDNDFEENCSTGTRSPSSPVTEEDTSRPKGTRKIADENVMEADESDRKPAAAKALDDGQRESPRKSTKRTAFKSNRRRRPVRNGQLGDVTQRKQKVAAARAPSGSGDESSTSSLPTSRQNQVPRKRHASESKVNASPAANKRARTKRKQAPLAKATKRRASIQNPPTERPPPPLRVPNYSVEPIRAPRMSVEIADTYEEYDGRVVNVDAYMDVKDWQVQELLDKEIRENGKVYYLCKWEDTWETRGMFRALKSYKNVGYKVKIQQRQ